MGETFFNVIFYFTACVSTLSTIIMITRYNAVHALLWLIVSSLSMAIIFYLLGAAFAAVLEVIIYAGAVMILFVFVVMMLNLGKRSVEQEKSWLPPKLWLLPSILVLGLLAALLSVMIDPVQTSVNISSAHEVSPKRVGIALFGPYLLVVELASFLLLAGLIGAYHIARSPSGQAQIFDENVKQNIEGLGVLEPVGDVVEKRADNE